MNTSPYQVLKKPILTEKSIQLASKGQYTFEVLFTNKIELIKAFEVTYPGRKVQQVRVVKIPSRSVRKGRITGMTSESRKAIFKVEGDPIQGFGGV